MQHVRIYCAWLPSVAFPNYGNVVEREKTVVNRLRRATTHGKFSRAELDVVLNSRLWKIPKQKIIQINHIASIFTQFWAFVRQFKMFQWTRKFRHFVHWLIAVLKFFKENPSSNFGLIAVFVKVAGFANTPKRVNYDQSLLDDRPHGFELSRIAGQWTATATLCLMILYTCRDHVPESLILDSYYSKMTPKFVKQKSHWLHSSITFANPEVASEKLQKELSIAFYPDSRVFMFLKIAQVYMRFADCRVYKGHLRNEWAIMPFRKHPKSSKFVCINSSLQFMHTLS